MKELSARWKSQELMLEESLERWKGGVHELLKLKAFDRARYNNAIEIARGYYRERLPDSWTVGDLMDLFWGREFDMELNQMLREELKFSFNLLIVKPTAYYYLHRELKGAKTAVIAARA